MKEGRKNEGGNRQKERNDNDNIDNDINKQLAGLHQWFSIIGLTIIGSSGHIVKLEAYNQCWVQR